MIAPDGTEVLETNLDDRRHRYCLCRKCGIVQLCTPQWDFWDVFGDQPGDGLVCQRCFNEISLVRSNWPKGYPPE